MAGNRRSGGTWITPTGRYRRSGGTWVALTIAKRRQGGAWVDLFTGVPTASITSRNVNGVSASPTDCSVSYIVNTSGVVQRNINGAVVTLETWILSGTAADFQIRATITSGTLTSGTAGTWLNATTSPTWNKTRTNDVIGTDSVTMTIEVRRVSDSVVVSTAVVTLNAEVA